MIEFEEILTNEPVTSTPPSSKTVLDSHVELDAKMVCVVVLRVEMVLVDFAALVVSNS